MLHDTPLHFIWLGVIIERTGQTARILDVHHHAFSLALHPAAAPAAPSPGPSQTQGQMQSQMQSQISSLGEPPEEKHASLSSSPDSMGAAHKSAAASDEQEARQVVEVALWLSLLRTCYGFEPFMKLHHGPVTGEAAANFLIFEKRFPRSVLHCVHRVCELLAQVRPSDGASPAHSPALERARVLEEALAVRAQEPLDTAAMHALLTEVVD